MSTDFTWKLRALAGKLSAHIDGNLRQRAADALDSAFNGDDIREMAINYLCDEARARARDETRIAEYKATQRRKDEQEAAEQRERTARQSADNRQVHHNGKCHGIGGGPRGTCEFCSTDGHVGHHKPGSAAGIRGGCDRNMCRSCELCRSAWFEWDERECYRQAMYEIYENELREALHTEWTNELLAAEIAMPDGTRTTWGAATIEQHRSRHDMLAKNAMSNAEAAARHGQAIEALETSGAPNLTALVRPVAA